MPARTAPARPALRVQVTDGRGRPASAPGLAAWLARAAPRRARGVVSIALVADGEMRRLNREFHHVDRVTDVLSFPADPPGMAGVPVGRRSAGLPPGGSSRATPGGPKLLGDIAIARGVATRQARAEGHALAVELRVLALHGLLHLLGYDHERDRGTMRRVEERLRRRAGLPSALIARAAKTRPA